ncbi:hypothetical protein JOF53_000990 [Crossiella equi]|uniref:EF-hand domain-containing protein n=1 Tax=Crossiella equi TaxID=130796 RepID=A0ABS5A693_9PSEU|nr:EF-hand domain-containing protein [Crossiella equi]MBP2472118.1 hypothetical protein [Crossiella equi]
MTFPSVRDVLDRKIDISFAHLDDNGDGVFEPADALALAWRIVDCAGAPPEDPRAQAVFAALAVFWQHIELTMDLNEDSVVTPGEWRHGARSAFHTNPAGFDAGLRPLAEATLALLDRDGDGRVNAEEFSAYHKAFGVSPADSRLAFTRLDRDGSGWLSVAELLGAWREFYTSDDPDAPGNWLYGDPGYQSTVD